MNLFIDTVLIGMTAELSSDYKTGKRIIADKQNVTIERFRDAVIWLSDAKFSEFSRSDETIELYVRSSKPNAEFEFDDRTIQCFMNKKWKKFDEWSSHYGLFWTVSLTQKCWLDSRCDCPCFLKHYMCKHIVGMSLHFKLCKLPRKAISVKLTKKPSKGRKPKATKALHK